MSQLLERARLGHRATRLLAQSDHVLMPSGPSHPRGLFRVGLLVATLLALAVAMAGCGGSDALPGAAETAPPVARACESAPGSITDLQSEPAAWRAAASEREWTTADGCLVRIDVVADYDGPEHCGLGSARRIVVGHPVGARYEDQGDPMEYVRDPENVYGDAQTRSKLDLDAALPDEATDTGLRLGAVEMWAIPDEPEWLYLRDGEAVERWPLDRETPLCR